MRPSLDLFFFYFNDKYLKKFKLSFLKKKENIDEKNKVTFSIPDIVFKHGKDKATIHISLFDKDDNSESYKFHVYYGKNSAYIQIDSFSNNVYELIFWNLNAIKISELGKEFTELDDLGNRDRKRLTLINFRSRFLKINGNDIDLSNIVFQNSSQSKVPFNQISVLDLEKRLFIVQPIKDKREYDIQFLKDNKEFLLTFESKFNKFFNSSKSDYLINGKELINTFQKIKIHGSLDLNRDNNYLDDIFTQNEFLDLDLFWNYSLCIFFIDNSTEDLYKHGKDVQKLISKIKDIKDNLNKIEILPLYEKARTIYSIFTVFFMKGVLFLNSNEIDNLNLRIFLTDQKEKGSIMDRSYQMYKEFVNSISEDSAIFPYLLNFNSGCGYYNKEEVYTFDLKNLDMIKAHLNQVYPKVIIFCYVENGEEAMTESEFGGIIINDYHLSKSNNNLDYNSSSLKKITEEEKNDLAVGIFLKKIHEASGHKKYALSEEENNSPGKIFNKNKKIVTLKHENDYVPGDNNCEYILRSYNSNGDSGHYLELGYGKYKHKLIISILRDMKDKGNLIYYPRLFTDDGKLLNEYVSLREEIRENGLKFISENKTSIYDEINQMRTVLENNKIQNNKNEILIEDISNTNESNENMLLKKGKRKREKDIRDNNETEDNKTEENKTADYNTQNKNKRYTSNYLKATNNYIKKEESKNENAFNEKEQKSDEKRNPTRMERVNNAIKRVSERFNIKKEFCLKKRNLREILNSLDINDPYFRDVSFLLSYINIKI